MNKRLISLILILGFLLLSLPLFAKQELWKFYPEALEDAQKSGKLILLKAYQEQCHYCENMERNVFSDSAFSQWLREHFEPTAVNITHETMPLGLKVTITPSFYILDKNLKLVKRIPGSWSLKDFKSLLIKYTKENH